MSKYEVCDVVCDYGVCEDGELITQLILNSRANALLIAEILNADEKHTIHPRAANGAWIATAQVRGRGEPCESTIYHCVCCGRACKIRDGLKPPIFCDRCGSKNREVTSDD